MGTRVRLATAPKRIQAPEGKPFKLDLGCGYAKQPDCIGIDLHETPQTDYVWDLRKTPWPIDDGVVDFIFLNYVLGFFDGPERLRIFDECWRVLKPKAQIQVVVPREGSLKAIQDPLWKWPPFNEQSFLYLNKEWREREHHGHYPVACDFDYGYGFGLHPDIVTRNQEYQQYAAKHLREAAVDLHVTLTKRE